MNVGRENMRETILEVKNVSKRFPGVLALDKVNFVLGKGEVHSLIGENGAGKSTLMKILLGVYKPDSGEIFYKGEKRNFTGPHDALTSGICMIHQEVSLIPTIDVAENIWIGREKRFLRGGLIDTKLRRKQAQELLDKWGIKLDIKKRVSTMSMAEMQLVEIARALSYDPEVIIMDEPTSSLAEAEITVLYSIIRRLSKSGVSVVFISHKLEEIFEISEKVTVFRDGKFIGTKDVNDITMNQLISMIVGREVDKVFERTSGEIGEELLRVEGLTRKGVFSSIDFNLHKGEIIGFSGLVGAGRTEIARAIFGADKIDSGKIFINGKAVEINSPKMAVNNKIAMVSEDRLHEGIFANLSTGLNITMVAIYKILSRMRFLSSGKERRISNEMIKRLNVKVSTASQPIRLLSGGNQQKAIIARWLLSDPEILILDEPTRGIDVGSKSEIYKLISDLADRGLGIILISSEMPELLNLSDRIYVIRDGRIVSEYTHKEADQEKLIKDAFGTVEQ